MSAPIEPEVESGLADRVDAALAALWQGDAGEFDRLCASSSSEGVDGKDMFKGILGEQALLGLAMPAPDAIPGYRLVREIGRGGMGVVYEAIQEGTKRTVAVKVLLAGVFASETAQRRFGREVELAASLQHPGIVRVLESRLLPSGQRYYAMDYVPGPALDQYLRTAKPGASDVVRLFVKLCEALHHAHEHDVVHRDLKPGNVIIDNQGQPHILDFGLAKSLGSGGETDAMSMTVSAPGQFVGTIRYVSPEQAAGGQEQIDARTDVYSLGVMLYEALTGSLPYRPAKRPSELIRCIMEEPPRPPSSIGGAVSRELEAIVLKALEKDREKRYQSAAEFAEDLLHYLSGEPIVARPIGRLCRTGRKLLRHRRVVLAISVPLVAAAIALIAVFWTAQRDYTQSRELARREVILIMRDLEAGRASRAATDAGGPFERHPDLAEAFLVGMQAAYRNGLRTGDQAVCNDAVGRLRYGSKASPPWLRRLMLAEVSRGDPQAERLRDSAVAEAPDTDEAWYLRSYATFDTREAARCTREALRRNGRHELAWGRLAHLCVLNEEQDGALQAAEHLIALGENRCQWELFKADVLNLHRQHAQAVESFTRLLDECTADGIQRSNCLRHRALAKTCMRDFAGACDDYTKSERRLPVENRWVYYQRATPLWILGRLEEAAADYDRTLETQGFRVSYATVRLYLVLCERARLVKAQGGSCEDIAEKARQVLAGGRASATPESWLSKILACLDGEMSPAALVEAARQDDIEQVCEGYFYAGETCLLRGREEEAVQWYRRCVETDLLFDKDQFPPDPMNEFHLARWRLETLTGSRTTGPAS